MLDTLKDRPVSSRAPIRSGINATIPGGPNMSMTAVQQPVRRELERVQTPVSATLFRTPIPILNQVGGHVLATRGKKFRPTLLLLVARLRGQPRQGGRAAARRWSRWCTRPR